MKISRGRNVSVLLKSLFKRIAKSREYFNYKRKYLLDYYLRFYRRRRHSVVGNVLKFRDKRAVIAHNVLRIKGGLRRRCRRPHTRIFYGAPITTRPIRKKKKRKQEKLPVQLQNVSSTTKPAINEKTESNGEDISLVQIDGAAAMVAPAANSIVITNSEKTCASMNEDISTVTVPLETTEPVNELEDNSTNNIWNLDLATVALEMTDENLPSSDDDTPNGYTNGPVRMLSNEPVSTSTPILSANISLFQSPAARPASPVEDINEKLRRQLKLLKMGKTEKPALPAPQSPIITRISLRRNTIAAEPVKPPVHSDRTKSNETSTNSLSQNTSPRITTNGSCSSSSRNSIDATLTTDKDTPSKSKTSTGLIDSLFNRLSSLRAQQTPTSAGASPDERARAASKRRSTTPLIGAKSVNLHRTSLDRAPRTSAPTVRELLQIKRTGELAQEEQDDDNVSTCSSSNADFLGFDMTNKNIDVSALLPTPRVKSTKESVFVSEDLDAFMKENSLENVANVEIVVAAKVNDVDEALITDEAQPPALTIPERPIDMQRPRTLAEKRLILQRQKDVHYQMIEHESTVYHELKKRVRMGSNYRNEHLRSIQDAEIPFTRDCWRATCWINTDNNYFFYRTLVCGSNELKLSGGRGNNKSKLFCQLPDDIDGVKSDVKSKKCDCPRFDHIKINNYEEYRRAVADHGSFGDSLGTLKKLNNLKREYIRPCPLSKKPKVAKRTSLDIEYGELELLTMPTVQLELWPKVGDALPDQLKPLLKTILPEGSQVTAEWAQFAASMVVEPRPSPAPQRPQKQQRKFKRPVPEERKSFVFDIPYVNNQTRIIVRRRRHPLAEGSTREPIEMFYENDSFDLDFMQAVDRSDPVASECADALCAMIESVAVTLNENNFIRNDPDLDYVGKVVPIENDTGALKTENDTQLTAFDSVGKDKISSTAKMDKGTSKLKVMKELKRLNVTIINALPDEKPNEDIKREDCKKTFCQMGCVCESIAKTTTFSNRCSNTKCMFDCKCSSITNQSHFNVPIDLLNKDLGNLHARATARLAKEEKDFTSTIVVSDHDMFVLPNSIRASKRSARKPKRYNECSGSYDSSEEHDSTLSSSPPAPKRARQAASSGYAYDQSIIDSIRHVTVLAKKLPDLEVETWCMVHCLYKCYCDAAAIVGKPFSFANASATEKPIEYRSDDVMDDTAKAYSHWESIPPRRRQYSFDRSSASNAQPARTQSQMNDEIAEQRSLRAARTRMFRWKIERKRRSIYEVQELRRQCDEVEVAYREYLANRIELCKQHFLRESWKSRAARDQKQTTDASAPESSDDIQFVAEVRVPATYAKKTSPETSVTQLNRIITNTMRTVCAIQRRNLLKLNTEQFKISIVRWDRMVAAFKDSEIFVWNTLLTDGSSVLLLTNDEKNSIPSSPNIRKATNIVDIDNDDLPLVAQMMKTAVKNGETTQLAVLLFRLSSFWRIVGVMHSDKRYIDEGLHASPSAEDNPELTKKIDQLHRLLIQRENQAAHRVSNVAGQSRTQPTTAPATATEAPPITDVVTARSNLTLENLQNMTEYQLQILLPIPLSQDQRWLMMTLGSDFTHIWLPQWRKFLSYKRIRSALAYAAQTRKTIELSPPGCHPSVFVTSARSNQIFVGPYHMDEPQKLALFYRHADGRMLLSENYAKLANVPPFLRRSIGSWVYTSPTAASKSAEKVDAVAPAANVQQTIPPLKIKSVYSMGNAANGQPVRREMGETLLKPRPAAPNAVVSGNPNNPVIRLMHPATIVRKVPNTTASSPTPVTIVRKVPNTTANNPVPVTIVRRVPTTTVNTPASSSSANATASKVTIAKPPIIISKLANQPQRMPVIASIQSYGETLSKLPIISSVQSGNDVRRTLNNAPMSTASSPASEATSEPVTLVEVLAVADATPSTSEKTMPSDVEIIDLSDEDEDGDSNAGSNNVATDDGVDGEQLVNGDCETSNESALRLGRIRTSGYIICPQNRDLGKIPAEVVNNTITLKIGSCDKEAELPIDFVAGETFDSLNTVDKYMSQLITNIAYSVQPKNLLLKWKFVPDSNPEHRSLLIHNTRSLNSYSVVFKDNSLSIQSNYSSRSDLDETRKYILDVEKLASQILPRNVAKGCPLKSIIEKATELEKKLECEKIQLAKLKDRYSRMIAAKLKVYRLLQAERAASIRAHGPE